MLGFELSEIRSVDVMASLDPLEWCKMHNTQFPTIEKLARKYLAIPVSSAPSESEVFSRAKLIQERQRWSLHVLPQQLEASKAQCMDASKEISQCYCSMCYK